MAKNLGFPWGTAPKRREDTFGINMYRIAIQNFTLIIATVAEISATGQQSKKQQTVPFYTLLCSVWRAIRTEF